MRRFPKQVSDDGNTLPYLWVYSPYGCGPLPGIGRLLVAWDTTDRLFIGTKKVTTIPSKGKVFGLTGHDELPRGAQAGPGMFRADEHFGIVAYSYAGTRSVHHDYTGHGCPVPEGKRAEILAWLYGAGLSDFFFWEDEQE